MSFLLMVLLTLRVCLLVLARKLIYCIVGQMHVLVVQIVFIRLFIVLSTKTGESHLVQVYSQGLHPVDEHIKT